MPGKTTQVLAAASVRTRFALGEVPGRTTLTANQIDSDVGSEAESRGFFRRYVSGGHAARARLERAIASRDHEAAVVATGALTQDLASARRHLANGLERDEGLRADLAALEGPAEQLFAKLPNMSAGGRPWQLWGPDSAEWRAVIGTAALEAGRAGELLAPPARTARHEDTEHLLAHAAPVPPSPQLVPGDIDRPTASASASAAAHPQAAASNGGPGAPHPVDALRANARGLAASLTSAGLGIGRATARWMQAAADRPVARRAVAIADQWTEGAARAWTERARGWADGAARRAMAFRDRMAGLDATEQLERLPTSGGAPMSDELRVRMEALFGHRFPHVRIHTDDAAAQAAEAAGARAVTLGSNIYFGRDQFAPGSEAGDRLLVHELTHVVQHDRGQLAEPAGPGIELSSPSDPAEREARAMEARAAEARAPEAFPRVRTLRRRPDDPRRAGGPQADLRSADAPVTQGRSPEELGAQSWSTGAQADGAQAIGAQAGGDVPAARAAVAPGARAKVTSGPSTDAPVTGRRASANIFGDAVNWVGDRIDDIENWAEDKIEGLVLKVAPGLGTLLKEGPGGLIKNAIEPAISSWVGSITGGVNLGQIAGQIKGSFASAFAVLQGAKAGDAKCCETLVHGINAIREVAHAFMNNPVMDALKGILTKVSDIISTVTKLVIGPAFEILKTIVGGAWDAIQSVASTIQGWFNAVKNIASKAFDWVARKLGFSSGTGEGGLLDWLKQKAAEIWDKIKQTLQPVLGPLKVVAGVLLMFTGLPEIYAIIKYGPQLVEAVQWLWANRNNPDAVKQNPKLIGGSILPKILGAGQSFVGLVKQGVSWLVEKTSAFATGALQLASAITGIPLLGMARSFVQSMVDGIKGVQEWAAGAFTSAESWLEGTFHKVADFIKPYAEVLCSVATAVVQPTMIPVILAGWAWRWLPDCIKPPLIDLLLDAVIGVLEHAPTFPMLGPLWSLLKAGVLGFLHAVRAKDPETKIKISNKLAKIISGASPMFLLGFVKGLLKGVWDGIKMPFEAIWMILKGIGKAGDFFVALGRDADHEAQKTAKPTLPKATALPAKPGAHPATGSTHPLPAVPSEIRPDEASSVVQRITGQLNADKPPRPAVPAATSSSPATKPGNAPPANDYRALGQEARRMGDELAGPTKTVVSGFWPAVQQLFSGGGKSMSIDDLMAKLHKVWDAAKAAVAKIGAKIANMICEFFVKDSAEEELGDAVGYLVGMIAFQALLDAFSVGVWSEVNVVLTAIAKFLNWPMLFLGEAMKALKLLGGYILDGLKSLGSMVAEAGAGALREVTGALREIAGKLGEFADELLAKFKGRAGAADETAARTAADDAASAAGRDANAVERDGVGDGKPAKDEPSSARSAADKQAQKAEELAEAIAISKAITRAEDAGRVPGPAVAASLESLKIRYTWIKTYEARPNSLGFYIHLIASDEPIDQVHSHGSIEGGVPESGATPPLKDGRFDVTSQSNIDALRANPPRAPAGTDPELAAQYDEYVKKKLAQAERDLAKGKVPEGPSDFTGYQKSLDDFSFGPQGKEYQSNRADHVRAQNENPDALIETDLGLKKEPAGGLKPNESPTKFADTAVFEPPDKLRVESHKQRDFMDVVGNASKEQDMVNTVRADARELIRKYSGDVEIRRVGHPMYGKTVTVKEATLVLDGTLVPESLRDKIVEEATRAAASIDPNVTFHVVFWP